MQEIKLNGETVAIFHKVIDWKEGIHFLTPNETFIQAGTWWYQKGKDLRSHAHIVNKRVAERTQEVVVVMSGKMRVDLYDGSKLIHQEILTPGDMAVILNIGHGYQILEDNTKVIETKNGPFISVEKDKIFLNASSAAA